MLLHGPLLAYAKASGDELISFKLISHLPRLGGAERPEYTMPLREGIPLKQYPFTQHAETALKIAKNFLQEIGFWTWPEEPVNTVNPDDWASDNKTGKRVSADKGSPRCTVSEQIAPGHCADSVPWQHSYLYLMFNFTLNIFPTHIIT